MCVWRFVFCARSNATGFSQKKRKENIRHTKKSHPPPWCTAESMGSKQHPATVATMSNKHTKSTRQKIKILYFVCYIRGARLTCIRQNSRPAYRLKSVVMICECREWGSDHSLAIAFRRMPSSLLFALGWP